MLTQPTRIRHPRREVAHYFRSKYIFCVCRRAALSLLTQHDAAAAAECWAQRVICSSECRRHGISCQRRVEMSCHGHYHVDRFCVAPAQHYAADAASCWVNNDNAPLALLIHVFFAGFPHKQQRLSCYMPPFTLAAEKPKKEWKRGGVGVGILDNSL